MLIYLNLLFTIKDLKLETANLGKNPEFSTAFTFKLPPSPPAAVPSSPSYTYSFNGTLLHVIGFGGSGAEAGELAKLRPI